MVYNLFLSKKLCYTVYVVTVYISTSKFTARYIYTCLVFKFIILTQTAKVHLNELHWAPKAKQDKTWKSKTNQLGHLKQKIYIVISLMCYDCKSFVYIMIRIDTKYLEMRKITYQVKHIGEYFVPEHFIVIYVKYSYVIINTVILCYNFFKKSPYGY
jgi:hypothetical protein